MVDLRLSLAKKLDIHRQFRLGKLKAKYPKLFEPGGPPEEYLLDLYPYFFDKPQKFYNEAVFENTLSYLTTHYTQNSSNMLGDFALAAEELISGILSTAYYSKDVEYTSTDGIERDVKVRRYWGPWYQNLIEGCLKNVCVALVLAALRKDKPSAMLQGMDVYNRAEKLRTVTTYDFSIVFEDYDSIIRNGCAHAGITLIKDGSIEFRDSKGKKASWTDDELVYHIYNLLDVCNALIFATRIFILSNWSQLSNIFAYQALSVEEREVLFLANVTISTVKLESAELLTTADSQLQVNIKATSKASNYEELLLEFLAILQRVPSYYPEVDRVFLHLKNLHRSPLWIAIPMLLLRDWANGTKSYEHLLQGAEFEHIFSPFKQISLLRGAASSQRIPLHDLPQLQAELREASEPPHRIWKILEVKNHFFLVNRIAVTILIPEGLCRHEVELLLIEATNFIREKKYRVEKKSLNYPIGYIWLNVFTKEKRPSDMLTIETLPYYVCLTEWFDERQTKKELHPILHLSDRVEDSEITVNWNPHYPKQ
jgi:hypothetical protein